MLTSMSGATPIAAGRYKLRLISLFAISLLVFGYLMGAFGDPAADSPADEGTLGCGMAATTIDSIIANPSTIYVGEEVTFTASASSTTGNPLTFTFFYDSITLPFQNNTHSPYSEHVTDNPGTVTTTFIYSSLGNLTSPSGSYFIVRLYVSDGTETKSDTETVFVLENTAPRFDSRLPGSISLLPDESVDLSIIVGDADDDPVTVTWDFGDGIVAVNNTGNALTGIPVSQTHAWSPDIGPGMGPLLYYSLVVTLEDPYGNTRTATTEIAIELPYNGLPSIFLTPSTFSLDPGEEMTFYANATDPEGEALTWTFVLDNNIEDVDVLVYHTSVTPPGQKVWNNVTYAFENPGTYNVRLYVSDAQIPYQIFPHNVTKTRQVYVVGNAVPSVVDQIAMSDESPSIDTAAGFVDVVFTVQAYDSDGDSLLVTWDLGGDGNPATNTSAGGLVTYIFRQVRTFTTPGIYNISVVVTDGIVGHEVVSYRLATVTSDNLPPVVVELNFTYETGDFAIPGESVEFTLILSDPEMDSLELIWDFGDNTSRRYYNLTDYADGKVTCVLNHTYYEVGAYNITIWYTDNQIGLLTHNKEKYVVVTVGELYVAAEVHWNWWDYVSILLLVMVPVVLILNVRRIQIQRRRIEDEGISWEEMKLRESEMFDEQEEDFYTEVD